MPLSYWSHGDARWQALCCVAAVQQLPLGSAPYHDVYNTWFSGVTFFKKLMYSFV